MAAGRLATLSGTSYRRPPPRAPISHLSSRPAARPCARWPPVMLAAVVSGTAMARAEATPCAKQVIADWYDDGRVGKIYPLECYRQAIAKPAARRARLLEREGGDRPRTRLRKTGEARPGRRGPDASDGLDGDRRRHDRHEHDRNRHDRNGTTDNGHDRNGHVRSRHADDRHLGAVVGADPAGRARRACRIAPRRRLGRLSPPPHEWRRGAATARRRPPRSGRRAVHWADGSGSFFSCKLRENSASCPEKQAVVGTVRPTS